MACVPGNRGNTGPTVVVDASSDAGPFDMLIGTNGQPSDNRSIKDFTDIYHQLGFEAVRLHDTYGLADWHTMFPDWEADPDDPASYDFSKADPIVKDLHDEGFEILFRLGSSWRDREKTTQSDPPGTMRNSQQKVTRKSSNKDFKKFGQVCKHIVMHYNDGWGKGFRFDIKRWEIWNEPSLRKHFWRGTPEQFYEMFNAVAKTLKEYDSSLIIGGPGLAGKGNVRFAEDLIQQAKKNKVPIDFYSFHWYGGLPDENGEISPWELAPRARRLRQALDEAGYSDTFLSLDEWNAGLSGNNMSNTGCGAAFIGGQLITMLDMGITETYQFRGNDHAKLGTIGKDGELRVGSYVFIAYKALREDAHRLNVVEPQLDGVRTIASASSDGTRASVLLVNYLGTTSDLTVRFDNLPSSSGGYKVTRKRISDSEKLVVIEELSHKKRGALKVPLTLHTDTVQLIEVEAQ